MIMHRRLIFIIFTIFLAYTSNADVQIYPDYAHKACQVYSGVSIQEELMPICVAGVHSKDASTLLEKDIRKISDAIQDDLFLEELKKTAIEQLNSNKDSLILLQGCLKQSTPNHECENRLETVLSTLKIALPRVRALMAQMDTPGHYFSATLPQRFARHKLKHQINNVQVHDLTEQEIEFLNIHTEKLASDFYQLVLQKREIKDIESCIDSSNPNLLKLLEDKHCQKFERMINYRVNNLFDDQNKIYKEQYNEVITAYPMLSLLKVSSEDSNQDIFQDMANALEGLLDKTMSTLKRVENLKGKDRLELLALKNAVNSTLLKNGADLETCNTSQRLTERHDFSQIKTDLLIAGGAILGGGICAFTSGLGCAVGVALGTEAVFLSVTQHRLSLAEAEFYTGLGDATLVSEKEFDRNLTLFLTPLSLFGHAGTTVAKNRVVATDLFKKAANSSTWKNVKEYPYPIGNLSIGFYTVGFNYLVNPGLRRGTPNLFQKVYASSLSKSLKKLKPHVGTVYRTDEVPDEVLKHLIVEGGVYVEKGFMSSTKWIDYNHTGRKNVKLVITSKTGRDVSVVPVNGHKREGEVIFLPETKFKINKVTKVEESYPELHLYRNPSDLELYVIELIEI